jgi:integrase
MRVFRSCFTKNGRTTPTRKWYIEWRDHRGTPRRTPGYTSKAATDELGRNIDRLVAFARASGGQVDPSLQSFVSNLPRTLVNQFTSIGLVKSERVAVSKPLTEHLDDYARALAAKRNTDKHVKLARNRIERVFKACGFRYWDDISASKVQAFLSELRQSVEQNDGERKLGISAQTFNYYLGSLKAFCRWMVKDRRAMSSPVSHLDILNVLTDRRYQRRALIEDELRRLIGAAQDGQELFGRDNDGIISWRLSGFDRAMLYRLAVETGLRAGELRSLTPSCFDLGADVPTVTVLAAYSKHRRDDTLPLLGSTRAQLGEYMMEMAPDERVFKLPPREGLAEMLRVDLQAAGIPVRDSLNRVVDFHALRHTFITNLAQGGVHPKTAQALARHSTITLTMDRYSHSNRGDEARALSALPDLSGPRRPQPGRADASQSDAKSSASRSAELGGPEDSDGDLARLNGHSRGRPDKPVRHGKTSDSQVAPVGFEPTHPEEGSRILSPLRLPFRHGPEEADSTGDGAILEAVRQKDREQIPVLLGVMDRELAELIAAWPNVPRQPPSHRRRPAMVAADTINRGQAVVLPPRTTIMNSPRSAAPIPPTMYHVVASVNLPVKVLCIWSAKECDEFIPITNRTTPTTSRTIPTRR